MNTWTPSDYVLVIGAIFTGLCSLVAAIKATKADNKATIAAQKSDIAAIEAKAVSEKANENSQKIDEVHHLTNGNLSRTQEELEIEKRKNEWLEKLITELTDNCPPGELDKAKKNLLAKQAKIGKRRKTDVTRAEDSKHE